MSDLISRKAAIEAMEKSEWGYLWECEQVINVVKALPSVEPERKWIPVTERLPEYGERVLTTTEAGNRGKKVRSGTYTKSLFQCDNGDVWTVTDKEVIAWMPLPEPYRGE